MAESLKVIARFRGQEALPSQSVSDSANQSVTSLFDWKVNQNAKSVQFSKNAGSHKPDDVFTFDGVMDSQGSQEQMYQMVAQDNIVQLLNGYNVTIMAYGQSGSGKTYSMMGPDSVVKAITTGIADRQVPDSVQQLYGIIPRAVVQIFDLIKATQQQKNSQFTVKTSYMEIYNESLNDLLTQNSQCEQNLKLRERKDGCIMVMGANVVTVSCPEDIFELLMVGQRVRAVSSTNQNERSSRSHTIFLVEVIQTLPDGSIISGKLNLVDLAGSERLSKTGSTGTVLTEAKKINQSLATLGLCIKQLSESSQFINYRDSKLTYLLKETLGGNCKTTLVFTASKQKQHLEESLQTLKFAQRAKHIKNKVVLNVQKSPQELEQIIARLRQEVTELKLQIGHPDVNLINHSIGQPSNARPDQNIICTSEQLQLKLSELEASHEHLKEQSETQILALTERLRISEQNNEALNYDTILQEKDSELQVLKIAHINELDQLREQSITLRTQLDIKTEQVNLLQAQYDQIWQKMLAGDCLTIYQESADDQSSVEQQLDQFQIDIQSEIKKCFDADSQLVQTLSVQLAQSEFYKDFKANRDSNEQTMFQFQALLASQESMFSLLETAQEMRHSNQKLSLLNSKLLDLLRVCGNKVELPRIISIEEHHNHEQLKKDFSNALKYGAEQTEKLQNLDSEYRRTTQDLHDKLNAQTIDLNQLKSKLSHYSKQNVDLNKLLSTHRTELTNHKLLQSKTIATALANIKKRKKQAHMCGIFNYSPHKQLQQSAQKAELPTSSTSTLISPQRKRTTFDDPSAFQSPDLMATPLRQFAQSAAKQQSRKQGLMPSTEKKQPKQSLHNVKGSLISEGLVVFKGDQEGSDEFELK